LDEIISKINNPAGPNGNVNLQNNPSNNNIQQNNLIDDNSIDQNKLFDYVNKSSDNENTQNNEFNSKLNDNAINNASNNLKNDNQTDTTLDSKVNPDNQSQSISQQNAKSKKSSMDENSIISGLFYKKDNVTNQLRIAKAKTISIALFFLLLIYMLYTTYIDYGVLYFEDYLGAIMGALFITIPIFAVGWIIGKLMEGSTNSYQQVPNQVPNQQFNQMPYQQYLNQQVPYHQYPNYPNNNPQYNQVPNSQIPNNQVASDNSTPMNNQNYHNPPVNNQEVNDK